MSSRKNKITRLPLIASAVLDSDPDSCLIVGIPPVTELLPKRYINDEDCCLKKCWLLNISLPIKEKVEFNNLGSVLYQL